MLMRRDPTPPQSNPIHPHPPHRTARTPPHPTLSPTDQAGPHPNPSPPHPAPPHLTARLLGVPRDNHGASQATRRALRLCKTSAVAYSATQPSPSLSASLRLSRSLSAFPLLLLGGPSLPGSLFPSPFPSLPVVQAVQAPSPCLLLCLSPSLSSPPPRGCRFRLAAQPRAGLSARPSSPFSLSAPLMLVADRACNTAPSSNSL